MNNRGGRTPNPNSPFNQKLAQMMMGRHGSDQLSLALLAVVMVLLFLTLIPGLWFLQGVATVLLVWSFFRIFSRNHEARERENAAFLRITEKPRAFLNKQAVKRANKDTTCYFKCKHCGTEYKVPKGKGKIRVICPKCHEQTIHTT